MGYMSLPAQYVVHRHREVKPIANWNVWCGKAVSWHLAKFWFANWQSDCTM